MTVKTFVKLYYTYIRIVHSACTVFGDVPIDVEHRVAATKDDKNSRNGKCHKMLPKVLIWDL